ncbi:MAG: hypothetical protein ACE5FY_03800 [Nitrospiria bacterium]
MSKKVRTLLILSGLVIFLSWGFRLYVLYSRWEYDPFIILHFALALIFFSIGGFILLMAKKGAISSRKDYQILFYMALFTILWWGFRWVKVTLYPEEDPNARAHLHLASLYLVIGALLLLTGWKGQEKDKGKIKKIRNRLE